MKQLTFVLALIVGTSSTFASDPGEPLDCSDWVFLEPGLSCEMVSPPVWPGCSGLWCQPSNDTKAVDVIGRALAVRYVPEFRWIVCGTCNLPVGRTELVAWTEFGETVLAYVEDRCLPNVDCTMDRIRARGPDDGLASAWLSFDPTHGEVIAAVSWLPYDPGDDDVPGTIRFSGFTTTFEMLQSYTPTASEIGFRVPYMPEGFQYADYFDTYWGDLATVGDWSKAQPLQCGYPVSPPSVGSYLTVEDTLPPLQPNQGRYYVTAVHHQGQTRYGRKFSGGVLTGRDPALLPGCE